MFFARPAFLRAKFLTGYVECDFFSRKKRFFENHSFMD